MLQFLLTATAVITGSSVIYFFIYHRRLSSRIQHRSHRGKLSASSPKPAEIQSVPESVFTDRYFALYDRSSRPVSRDALPSGIPLDLLFTKLVRRNMTAFAHFPQALMIRFVSKTPEEQRSFKASYIASLDFHEGELVCGVYRVIARSKNKVEFEMKIKTMEFASGRLAISFQEKDEQVVFSSEMMMWRRSDETQVMPLEKPLVRWMHETAAWWLMDSGVRYVMDLEG
ncbi:uncharacterized protein N7459_003345 [Penicillium hispanicum]|uniref:uncharacterized protein n=1 Tax=Penicillium hispanicum TaxID=1080232 RepID=UPI00253F7B27|nr:uncharacterized protein N7459_003345 [Penicillium hispanicum]KAJ5587580.1 hypothetical protein N7459_003345 [Penicillium hispanicum]